MFILVSFCTQNRSGMKNHIIRPGSGSEKPCNMRGFKGQKLTANPAFAAYNHAAVFSLRLQRKPRNSRPVCLPAGRLHYIRDTFVYPLWLGSWLEPFSAQDQEAARRFENTGNMILSTTYPAYSTPHNPRGGSQSPDHSLHTCLSPACGLLPAHGGSVHGRLLSSIPWYTPSLPIAGDSNARQHIPMQARPCQKPQPQQGEPGGGFRRGSGR